MVSVRQVRFCFVGFEEILVRLNQNKKKKGKTWEDHRRSRHDIELNTDPLSQMTQINKHVDLEKGILYETLLQIREADESYSTKNPGLVHVWVGDIDPRKSKILMQFLKKYFPLDESSQLDHFKRIRKVGDHLQVLICKYESEEQTTQITELARNIDPDFVISGFKVIAVPKHVPSTKELTQQWSEGYWPITWKGNPNHQFLNSVTFDMAQEREMVNKLLESLCDGSLPSSKICHLGTLIAQYRGDNLEVCTIQTMEGKKMNNPRNHSVMKAISEIAKQEIENRKNKEHDRGYLCTDMIVYTTHEPCVMCCMALVHSRIARVTYIKATKESGGFETHYQLGDIDGLNWKFQIWKWLGNAEILKLEDINRDRHTCIEF